MEGRKAAIGRVAAELSHSGSSLFLHHRHDCRRLARAIAERRPGGLRVVTNSTVVASILDQCPDIAIEVTGGSWMRHDRSFGGPAAVAMVEGYRDSAHDGVGGIDPEGNLLEHREPVAIVGRAMFRNARRRVLLADHTKFLRVATSRLAHLREVDVLVTDRRPPPERARLIEAAGCRLLIAG
ncbi:MAG: hypothetical protein R3D28_11830 [Geminicoccaceae bacterium]